MKFIEKQKTKNFLRLGCAALATMLAVGSVPFLRGFAAGNGGTAEPKVSFAENIYVVNDSNETVSGYHEVGKLYVTNRSTMTVTSDAVITMVTGGKIVIANDSVLHLHGTINGVGDDYSSYGSMNIYLCDEASFNASFDSVSSWGTRNYYGYNAATDGKGTLSVKNGDTEVTDSTVGGPDTTYTYTGIPGSSEYCSVIWTKGAGGEEIGRGLTIDVTCEENSHYQVYANFEKGHVLTKIDAKAATCTEDGNIDYWTCSGCHKIFSDANGTTEINEADVTIAALGHDFHDDDWTTVTQPTETTPGEEEHFCHRDGCGEREAREIPALGVDDYQFTADSLFKWTKGSTDGLPMVIKNTSGDDTQTFSKLVGVSVDGTALTSGTDYTAERGSIKLTLSPAYLETLATGEHTLSVELTVTTLTHTFTVAAPASTDSEYQFTADSLFKWTKGSTDGLPMVIKNTSGDDTQTFDKLKKVSVDGTELTLNTDYTAEPGSIKLTLSPAYLETLKPGEHTLSVELTVTTLTHTFTVAAPAATDSPATGESLLLISGSLILMLLAAGGVAYVLIRRRKTAA